MVTPRVLFINPILYHYRAGVFRALDARRDIEATFASDTKSRDGIAVIQPSELSRHRRLRARRFGRLEWHQGVVSLLLRASFSDVVFLGDVSTVSTWIGALVARARGMRVYFWTIGWHRPERGIKRVIRMTFYRLADRLLLYGNGAVEIGAALGYPREKMSVIGNSIDPHAKVPRRGAIRLPTRQASVAWYGAVIRLTSVKRLDMLVDAVAMLREQGHDARVMLVGAGPEEPRLRSRANERGVPLSLTGPAYDTEDLSRVYEVLDVTVVPAAVGLSAIQSLAYGVPVVSDDDSYAQMPEWEAIKPGATGETYRSGSVEGLAQAMMRVTERLQREREYVAAVCRDEYSRWSPEAHAARIAKVLIADGQ